VNRIFRLGIMIALLVLVVSGFMALRIIFVDRPEVDVPALVGLSAVEATNSLQGAGLVARIDQVDSDQQEGVVISQVPAAGEKVEKGKIVTLRASRGGSQSRIPDVRGLEFAVAARTLDESGFKVGAVLRVSDSLKPSGTIIAQNPASPAMVLNNRMVDLLVSEGQTGKNEMVQVPDLKGQAEALARQIIQQSDLTVAKVLTVESNQAPIGAVVRTQPRAGSRVPAGNAVTIYIAKEPEAPRIPAEQAAADGNPTPVITTTPVQETPPQQVETPVRQAPVMPEWDPRSAATQGTAVQTQPPAGGNDVTEQPRPAVAGKTARIRYQVPPLTRSLQLRIEITDQSGTRTLRDQTATGGEYISMNEPYSGNATVAVRLGGEMVWQERYD
jgi:serine/threonine-protein kinase